jgi:hypothetical protein
LGCTHTKGLEKKDIESLSMLGETSWALARLVWNFMKSFWVKFGRADARSMVEARRTAVSSFSLASFVL